MTSLAASPSWSFPSSSSTLIELREDLQEVGGGRGIFAKTAVRAGQLLLVEGPLVTVPHDKAPQVGGCKLHTHRTTYLLCCDDSDSVISVYLAMEGSRPHVHLVHRPSGGRGDRKESPLNRDGCGPARSHDMHGRCREGKASHRVAPLHFAHGQMPSDGSLHGQPSAVSHCLHVRTSSGPSQSG